MTYNVCESMPGWAPTIHRASNATQHTVCQLAINIATAHSHEYTMTENGSLTQYILIVFRLQKKLESQVLTFMSSSNVEPDRKGNASHPK